MNRRQGRGGEGGRKSFNENKWWITTHSTHSTASGYDLWKIDSIEVDVDEGARAALSLVSAIPVPGTAGHHFFLESAASTLNLGFKGLGFRV